MPNKLGERKDAGRNRKTDETNVNIDNICRPTHVKRRTALPDIDRLTDSTNRQLDKNWSTGLADRHIVKDRAT